MSRWNFHLSNCSVFRINRTPWKNINTRQKSTPGTPLEKINFETVSMGFGENKGGRGNCFRFFGCIHSVKVTQPVFLHKKYTVLIAYRNTEGINRLPANSARVNVEYPENPISKIDKTPLHVYRSNTKGGVS